MFIGILIVVTCLTSMSVWALWRLRQRTGGVPTERPPVTILKPLCGADDGLAANLESFFTQDYEGLQIVFGVQGADDPAIAVVDRLRARFPDIDTRLVVHEGGRGINPKVSNLRAMLRAVTHDLVIVSDSNVRAHGSYVLEMVEALRDGVGLVTSVFSGSSERTLGAALENLHLTGSIASSVAASERFGGHTITVGKSMLFRRSLFESLGGFESVGAVLAEDYIIGRMFRAAGYRVALASHVVENVCQRTTLEGFARRNLRWSALRCRLKPLVYPFEPLTMPIAVALLAPLFGAPLGWSLLWAVAVTLLRDVLSWRLLRTTQRNRWIPLLGVPKDLIVLAVWAGAPFARRISWRGNRVLLSMGTRLYAGAPMASPGGSELR